MNNLIQSVKDYYNNKVKPFLKNMWLQNRVLFWISAAIVLVIKYRDILISILVNSGKKIYTQSQQKSDELQKQEKDLNDQANALVDQAKNAPDSEKPVDPDWYKK